MDKILKDLPVGAKIVVSYKARSHKVTVIESTTKTFTVVVQQSRLVLSKDDGWAVNGDESHILRNCYYNSINKHLLRPPLYTWEQLDQRKKEQARPSNEDLAELREYMLGYLTPDADTHDRIMRTYSKCSRINS